MFLMGWIDQVIERERGRSSKGRVVFVDRYQLMDSSSRRYPYPHELQISNYVQTKLTQFNHSIWKQRMIDFIRENGLIGFIDGTVQAPPDKINGADNQDYLYWKQSDSLVRGWILLTLEDDILTRVPESNTARELWTSLERSLFHPSITAPQNVSDAVVKCDLSRYLDLYHAALQSDWKTASEIINRDPNATRAIITGASETALLIAARSADRNQFAKKLLDELSPEDVIAQDEFGSTALHIAAEAGNIEVAKWLVDKNPLALIVYDNSKSLPIHRSCVSGKRATIDYLLSVMKPDLTNVTIDNPPPLETKPFEGESGLSLIHGLINGCLYDLALSLLQEYPTLAQAETSPLIPISMEHSAFLSGDHLSSWQHLIYSCVPIQLEDLGSHPVKGDIENPTFLLSEEQKLKEAFPKRVVTLAGQKGNAAFWKLALKLVPQIKRIQEKKLIYHQALELIRYICSQIIKLDPEKAKVIFGYPFLTAACSGNHVVVEEILAFFPSAIKIRSLKQQSFLHLAIVNRRENVFNLIYQFGGPKHMALSALDESMNNGMHLVGYMNSDYLVGSSQTPQKLNLRTSAACAALQMQCELQWFKEVEKFFQDTKQRNTTARIIFVETHEELAKEAEKWMKDWTKSCTTAAALVASLVLGLAITVPGGNNGHMGLPMFSGQKAFINFAVSDVFALAFSTCSGLIFLNISTSHYALEDFLYSLPKRLIFGHATLFFSLLLKMITFSDTFYLVFGDQKIWDLGLASALIGIPVILFTLLQFLPFLDIIKSTYGRGIFRKQSDRILY